MKNLLLFLFPLFLFISCSNKSIYESEVTISLISGPDFVIIDDEQLRKGKTLVLKYWEDDLPALNPYFGKPAKLRIEFRGDDHILKISQPGSFNINLDVFIDK